MHSSRNALNQSATSGEGRPIAVVGHHNTADHFLHTIRPMATDCPRMSRPTHLTVQIILEDRKALLSRNLIQKVIRHASH
jgi:hypothetical protein